MKRTILMIFFALGTPYVVLAQQRPMPDMSGMNMSQKQAKQQTSPAKPANPNRNHESPEAVPEDMETKLEIFTVLDKSNTPVHC